MTILFTDDFDRADGPPGTPTVGEPWVSPYGETWTLVDGHLRVTAPDPANPGGQLVSPVSHGNPDVSVDITLSASGDCLAGPVIRSSAGDAFAVITSHAMVYLFRLNAETGGTQVQLSTASIQSTDAMPHRVRLSALDADLVAYYDGAEVMRVPRPALLPQEGLSVGVANPYALQYDYYTAAIFDNLAVTDGAAGDPPSSVSDDFDGSAGPLDAAWVTNGTWATTGTEATITGIDGGGWTEAWRPIPDAADEIEVDAIIDGTNNYALLTFRGADGREIGVQVGGGVIIPIWRASGSDSTSAVPDAVPASADGPTVAGTYRLRVRDTGTGVDIYVDDVLVVSAPTTTRMVSGPGRSAVLGGFSGYGYTPPRFDNFTAHPAGTAPPGDLYVYTSVGGSETFSTAGDPVIRLLGPYVYTSVGVAETFSTAGDPVFEPGSVAHLSGTAVVDVEALGSLLAAHVRVALSGSADVDVVGAVATLHSAGHYTLGGIASVTVEAQFAILRSTGRTTLRTWHRDQSQAASFEIRSEATLNISPAIVDPPVGLPVPNERVIRKVTAFMPPLGDLVLGRPTNWRPTHIENTAAGRYRVVIGGKDVTFFRNSDTVVESYSFSDAFGPELATIDVTGVSPFEDLGVGPLRWLYDGANVEIDFVHAGTRQLTRLWEGWVASHEESISEARVQLLLQCKGVMLQADHILKQPDFDPTPRDIGYLLSKFFNQVPARRYAALNNAHTGIDVAVAGAWQPLTEWADEVLAQSTTDDGHGQWTVDVVRGRIPVLRLKNLTTVHWTVTAGAPGVLTQLSRDITQAPNVYYGSGTDAKGRYYSNQKFPNLHWGPVPPYLFTDVSRIANIGDSDADTATGDGISDFQRQMNAQGYKTAVTGVFGQDLWNKVDQACRDMGLNPGGSVGPHTFSGIYEVGTVNAGAFNGVYHAPLAIDSKVRPHTHSASGAVTGDNDAFNPHIIRVERYDQMPDGTTKDQAVRSERTELARSATPAYVGTVTLMSDPHQGSKALMRSAQNLLLENHHGGSTLLHITRMEKTREGGVVCTVDSLGRDYMTVAEIIKRNKEAVGPSRRKHRKKKSDMVATRPAFDSESPAGIVRRHPVNGDANLWTVIRVPLGWTGNVVGLNYKTTVPGSSTGAEFALAIFTQEVTSEDMRRLVGNPLARRTDNYEPFSKNARELEDKGLVYAAGGPGQPAGYWPGQKAGWDGKTTGHPVTGDFRDDAGFSFDTADGTPPYIYVAEYTSRSCYIEGRLLVAPSEA